MKIILLTTAFLCFFATLSYSQFQVDISSGLVHTPDEVGRNSRGNGIYAYASPSISLKDNFRLRSTFQYRKDRLGRSNSDNGSLELSPELEYTFFGFLSVGAGVFYAYDFNRVRNDELGVLAFLKIRNEEGFFTIRYNNVRLNKFEGLRQDFASRYSTFDSGEFLQIGIGTVLKKREK